MSARRSSPLTQKLFFYGVSAGAASLAASAQADIHYSGMLSATADQIYFNPVDGSTGSTTAGFSLNANTKSYYQGAPFNKTKTKQRASASGISTGYGIATDSNLNYALKLQANDTIGSGAMFNA